VNDSAGSDSAIAADVVARAAEAYRRLAELAESVEDEWQYVTDLVEAYLPAIEGLSAPEPEWRFAPEVVAAVDEAVAEIGLITDPHKAIDWLSTFPHIVALATGGDVDGETPVRGGSGASGPAGDTDDDSPFRALLGCDR
jgi:hypothetical protein